MCYNFLMDKRQIISSLQAQKETLNAFGVRSIALFGSFAREQNHAHSDIDLLVSFNRSVGLFEFVRLQLYLEKLLHRKVDLVTEEALRREMREQILHEAVYVA
ncbi:MAG: nucleotidyltransferase family protein [Anaerolineales bacterium]